MEKQVQLTDEAILLRPYSPDDTQALYEAVRESLKELLPWMPWAYPDYSLEDSKAWIAASPEKWAKDTEYNFAIIDAGDGTFLGGCGLNKVDRAKGWANLGYWVRTNRTKKGIATAAARLLADFGFHELDFKKIEVGADISNKISQRVAEKLGARRIGVEPRKIPYKDKIFEYTMAIFSLTPEDLEKGIECP